MVESRIPLIVEVIAEFAEARREPVGCAGRHVFVGQPLCDEYGLGGGGTIGVVVTRQLVTQLRRRRRVDGEEGVDVPAREVVVDVVDAAGRRVG